MLRLTRLCLAAAAVFAGAIAAIEAKAADGALPPPTVSALPPPAAGALPPPTAGDLALIDAVTFGVNASSVAGFQALGAEKWLQGQLHPAASTRLPPAAQAQVDALPLTHRSALELAVEVDAQGRAAGLNTDIGQRAAAAQVNQQTMSDLARQAANRTILRALYAPDQLRERMTWFWFNHFNVHQYNANLRVLVGDYEDHAIRAHALGRFRDILEATLRHPAMLRYLDNEQNAAGHINENYARELMELHTLGVDGGYSQKDVQELARVLTGVGVNATGKMPPMKPPLQAQYVRDGLFEFNPNRHDYGDKQLLGRTIRGRGLAEIDEVADLLSKHPATAHFVSRKLAVFFVADDPPAALVERMAQTFRRSDGDIAATLATMFHSPEFSASLGHKFKDPIHYVVSAVRLAYGDKPILNTNPMLGWLNRMGEPLYGRLTPDGYPLTEAAWASPGQMVARFEVARTIGANSAGLFKPDGPDAIELPAFPQLANALYYTATANRLDAATHQALDQSKSPQEWNMFLLASPEFMNR
jgi:uncharacterized protein (DUF1800 family)